MKELRFTRYFSERLKLRKIPEKVPEEILRYSDEKFYDRDTGGFISVKNVRVTKRRSQQ